MRSSAFPLSLLALLALLTAGCATIFSSAERPESLEPVTVDAPPQRAYDEALTLAFDRGYHIAYASEENHLIELEALDRQPLLLDRVLRVDLFIRERGGRTYVHARYHSFDAGDPGDIHVRDDDREAARQLVAALAERLGSPRALLPERDAGKEDAL